MLFYLRNENKCLFFLSHSLLKNKQSIQGGSRQMSRKITIIGAGSVGATIAYNLSQDDVASEIVLIDVNKDKVEGEVMDIIQGTCFRDPIAITAGDYADAKGSDIVIITSGVARKPGQSRLELTQTNVDIIKVSHQRLLQKHQMQSILL